MPSSRQRAKVPRPEDGEDKPVSALPADFRTCWLLSILTLHSEYFEACLGDAAFVEAAEKVIRFDDIEPKYLGYYLGLAASFSSIAPHAPPESAQPGPETPLRDQVEVYKLYDRFLSAHIGDLMLAYIYASIGCGHRALLRAYGNGTR
ncbi:hypothetical protein CDD83_9088 [Cordyceps sp. RAO-2017]|nr:hypothetical protein CDD83_9088 [Cordyceps sp. RAO-2017]